MSIIKMICKGMVVMGTGIMTACAAPVYTARFDTTATGGIVWPGQPETPRIKYLWSLRDVGFDEAAAKGGLADIIAGTPEVTAAERLLRPQGIFVDEKRYYIADPGALRVTVVDRATKTVLQVTGPKESGFEYPRSVVADRNGTMYVADSELRKVFVFSADGAFRYEFQGEFARPEGLALDTARGIVYVVDTDAHVVYRYGLDGVRLGSIGSMGRADGEFFYPTYAALDGSGGLYVTDFLNFRVQFFSPDGRFVSRIGSLGDSYATLEKPKGVAVDSEGHVYVVDGAQHTVKIFNREGRALLFFGQKGEGYGDLYLPAGIFIDRDDVIYVADTLNMRIQAFQYLRGK